MDDVEQLKDSVGNGQVCPIFSCSSFTGEGIDLIRRFMGILPKSIVRTQNISISKPKEGETCLEQNVPEAQQGDTEINTQFIIDSRYQSKGVGLILGGTILKGTIKLDQVMMFGPDKIGNFR